ncbi:MAG TPA: hypothetical protein VLT32_11505 [Candidatus Sulfomarinibacteraceae bacterium]|nr:hypothetical protein [Candidatus Sulfomarinibacteraceae bacterium]
MARRSSEEKRAFWRMVVQMQEESGLSVRKFCEREGLGQASFFGWRRKFRREAAEGCPSSDHGGESVRLAPVKLLDEKCPAAVEVVSPSGLILRVHDEANTENVRRVLQLMQEVG